MKEEKQKSFYSLAKYPTYEILMEGQIASAGAHQAKLIEKFKKNSKYIKHQFLALKIIYAILFTFLPALPMIGYLQSIDFLNKGTYSINTIFFVSSFLLMIYFGTTTLYLLMLGMVSTSSFMSGNSFKWLQTLPFSKKDLKKIGLMTIFRNFDLPLLILIAGLPVIMLIITGDILMFFICIGTNIVAVILSFSILVLIGEKMSYLFSESKSKSRRAGTVRLVTMLGYFILMFSTGFIFAWGINAGEALFDIFSTNDPPFLLIVILSLIPFLFAPAFFVSLYTVQYQVNPILILTTITGFALSIVLTWVIFKIAQRALHSAISTEIKVKEEKRKAVEFEVETTSPIKSYLRKDIVSSTRDIQSFMFIFFPIFYPLILVFSMTGLFTEVITTTMGLLIAWSSLLLVYLFVPIMLIVGLLNLEESGSSTLASLPIVPRDQAKAKLILMLSIQAISLTFTSIVLTIMSNSLLIVLLFLISLPIAWSLLLFMFLMKIKLFGQMKYKYILEELNKEHKILKWIAMILSMVGLYLTIVIIGTIIIFVFDLTIALITIGVIGVIGLLILIFTFNRMFPKVEKMPKYKTGGFLREHVNVSSLIVIILYTVFLILISYVIEPFILFLLPNLNFLGYLFVDFLLVFGLLGLVLMVIIPLGLKIPKRESFKDFLKTIGLSSNKKIWKDLLVGVGIFVVIVISILLFTFLFGEITFDFRYFENPNPLYYPSLAIFGWFIFIFALRPGIWEEVTFRGIILKMQLRKYPYITCIILNGIFFGLFHFANLLFGANLYGTLIQVIYASCIGVALSYVYIKTKSLIPAILAHYLLDSVGQIFLNGTFTNYFNRSLFLILGLGVFPMILIIIIIRLIFGKQQTTISLQTLN